MKDLVGSLATHDQCRQVADDEMPANCEVNKERRSLVHADVDALLVTKLTWPNRRSARGNEKDND